MLIANMPHDHAGKGGGVVLDRDPLNPPVCGEGWGGGGPLEVKDSWRALCSCV